MNHTLHADTHTHPAWFSTTATRRGVIVMYCLYVANRRHLLMRRLAPPGVELPCDREALELPVAMP